MQLMHAGVWASHSPRKVAVLPDKWQSWKVWEKRQVDGVREYGNNKIK